MRLLRGVMLPVLAAVLVAVMPTVSRADSWALPTVTTYPSGGGGARITVTPRELDDQLSYFEDKVKGAEPAGQKQRGTSRATARVERRVGTQWQLMWERPIANEVAPVSVMVRDDGAYTVTFDEWHGVGYGPNVMVIYDARGEVVRALSLSDIVPDVYIRALPHSVSSIQWRDVPRFSRDGRRVVIPVVIPQTDWGVTKAATIDIAVDLADGRVSPVSDRAWTKAHFNAVMRDAQIVIETAAEKEAFLAPLLGPGQADEDSWHEYLREATLRLSTGEDRYASTTVLRLPDAKDYAVSERWVRDALIGKGGDHVALASLSEPNLVALLARIAATLPDGALSERTLFVALSDRNWPDAVAAMKRTGATMVQLDPAEGIPQRPDRIADAYPDG